MYETISESFREKLCKKKRESVRDDNFESGRDGEIESAEQRQESKNCWMVLSKIAFELLNIFLSVGSLY